ncbi:MAG: hypothetical protein LBI86_09550 [Treponema sp.]|jgi:hypothetical protein|nr:hypothetical protein [Treponema sp.]
MDSREIPRIGNRSDALELLECLIDAVNSDGKGDEFIRQSLEALRDAVEREII